MNNVLTNRLCRGGCTLLAMSLSGQALAQQAYFSVEGEITFALGTHEMYFQTTRPLTTAEDVQFITFASSGGTNAAGDVIPGTGQVIDSLLDLFSFSAGLSASNDDGAFGPNTTLDSLLSWPGVAESGGTLPASGLPVANDYRLTFSDLGNNNVGAWAVDLIGPADALQLTQLTPNAANPGGVSRLDSLKFGTTGAGANAATFDYIGLTDLEIAGPLVVANTGNGVLNLAQGEITVGGPTTINSGGTVNITGGTLDADDDILIDGGTIDFTSGTLNLADGKTITARNNAQFTHAPGTSFNHDTTLIVESGADVLYQSFFGVGNSTGMDGTITVTGTGSTFTVSSGFNSFWGNTGGTATLNVLDNASANIALAGGVTLASSGDSNSFGDINVESGGDITFTRLDIATGSAASGEVTVTGTGSTFTQIGASTLTVGGTGTGTATLDVNDSGVFNSGTGDIAINPSGTVTVNTNGIFNANGNVTVDGGTIDSQTNGFRLASGKTLTASNDAQVTLNGGNNGIFYSINGSREIKVESGADVSFSNPINVGLGSASNGTITVDGSGSTLTINTDSLAGLSDVGAYGATGNLTVRNNAEATIHSGSLHVASTGGTSPSTSGTVNVESGGSFTLNNLRITHFDTNTGTGIVNVTDAGSTITQTGASQLIVGNAVGGTAELNISSNATFTTGTGDSTINATGTVNVNSGGDLYVKGDLILNGAGKLNASGGGTRVYINGTATLNTGSTFDVSSAAQIEADTVNINGGSFLMSGGGLSVNELQGVGSNLVWNGFVNFGVFNADLVSATPKTTTIGAGQSLTAQYTDVGRGSSANLLITGGGQVTAAGFTTSVGSTFDAARVGNVDITGAGSRWWAKQGLGVDNGTVNVMNNGELKVDGTLDILANGSVSIDSGATVTADSIYNAAGGTFDFTGGTLHVQTFHGTLTQDGGTLSPGSSAGLTTINGDYGFNTGVLDIEIGGITQDTGYDHVHVTGMAQLYGELNVSLINGFTTLPGDSFAILTAAGGIIDAFNLLNLPDISASNQAWQITNTGAAIVLDVLSTLAGDLNNDGFVGLDDLDIVLNNWNQNVTAGALTEGDPSGDGFVGLDDLDIVLNNWNNGTPPPINTTSIPEPGTAIILALNGFALGCRRHHKYKYN